MKAHKHSKLIKAWADGQVIELQAKDGRWLHSPHPSWNADLNYRIRPPAPNNSFLVKVTQYKTGRLKIGYRREAKNPDFPADLRLVLDKDGKLMRVESLSVQPITTMVD